MKPIPIFGTGFSSGYPSTTAQKRINCYLELVKDPEKSHVTLYGTSGLELFSFLGETPVRGMIAVNNYLYVAHRGIIYKIDNLLIDKDKVLKL